MDVINLHNSIIFDSYLLSRSLHRSSHWLGIAMRIRFDRQLNEISRHSNPNGVCFFLYADPYKLSFINGPTVDAA